MAVDALARAIAAGKVPVTAYQYAKEAGYTGTEEEFAEDMGNSATNATNAADSADAAAASAQEIAEDAAQININKTDISILSNRVTEIANPFGIVTQQTPNGIRIKPYVKPLATFAIFPIEFRQRPNNTMETVWIGAVPHNINGTPVAKMRVGIVFVNNNANPGEITQEAYPNNIRGTSVQQRVFTNRYAWNKSNLSGGVPVNVRPFVEAYTESDEVIQLVYGEQYQFTLVDGELHVEHFDFGGEYTGNGGTIIDAYIARTNKTVDYNEIVGTANNFEYVGALSNQVISELSSQTYSDIAPSYIFRDIASGDLTNYAYLAVMRTNDGKEHIVYKLDDCLLGIKPNIIVDQCEPGDCYSSNDGIQKNSDDYLYHRTHDLYKCSEQTNIKVSFNSGDNVSSARVIYYDSSFTFIKTENLTIDSNESSFMVPAGEDVAYLAIVCAHENDQYNFHGIEIASDNPLVKTFHPDKGAVETYNSMPFNYVVNGNVMTTGRLMLPPNYSVDGQKVPLVVFVHGSETFKEWDSPMKAEYLDYFEYLNNEGFALFDCFGWTDIVDLSGPTSNPIFTPSNVRAYIEGIKYVCSRYNVDIDSVVMLCKSLGGQLGHWAYTQNEFSFKAVGLFAPVSSAKETANAVMFYNSSAREAMVKQIVFDGTTTEKDAFVSSGSLTETNSASFITKNKRKLVSMFPFVHGITGSVKADDLYTFGTTNANALPAWMSGLPAYSSAYAALPGFISHDDFIINAKCPVKFWFAFDDANCSAYGNYAIYTWLLNGGSDAEFRVLPLNTGKHHAMDTDPDALKSSGTTALGIAYTDIPTAYVEAADFFRHSLVM